MDIIPKKLKKTKLPCLGNILEDLDLEIKISFADALNEMSDLVPTINYDALNPDDLLDSLKNKLGDFIPNIPDLEIVKYAQDLYDSAKSKFDEFQKKIDTAEKALMGFINKTTEKYCPDAESVKELLKKRLDELKNDQIELNLSGLKKKQKDAATKTLEKLKTKKKAFDMKEALKGKLKF